MSARVMALDEAMRRARREGDARAMAAYTEALDQLDGRHPAPRWLDVEELPSVGAPRSRQGGTSAPGPAPSAARAGDRAEPDRRGREATPSQPGDLVRLVAAAAEHYADRSQAWNARVEYDALGGVTITGTRPADEQAHGDAGGSGAEPSTAKLIEASDAAIAAARCAVIRADEFLARPLPTASDRPADR